MNKKCNYAQMTHILVQTLHTKKVPIISFKYTTRATQSRLCMFLLMHMKTTEHNNHVGEEEKSTNLLQVHSIYDAQETCNVLSFGLAGHSAGRQASSPLIVKYTHTLHASKKKKKK